VKSWTCGDDWFGQLSEGAWVGEADIYCFSMAALKDNNGGLSAAAFFEVANLEDAVKVNVVATAKAEIKESGHW
jgi:hypothetical protein